MEEKLREGLSPNSLLITDNVIMCVVYNKQYDKCLSPKKMKWKNCRETKYTVHGFYAEIWFFKSN